MPQNEWGYSTLPFLIHFHSHPVVSYFLGYLIGGSKHHVTRTGNTHSLQTGKVL
jgi:hypothetical protein